MACPINRRYNDYTVGWVCALPVELAASKAMLDDTHNPLPQRPGDNNLYTLGRIGNHNIVMTCLPLGVTGIASASAVVEAMLGTFRWLRFGLLVGVGGGVPSEEHDVRLGDVVVSKPNGLYGGVIHYKFGKTVQDGIFIRNKSLDKPSSAILRAVSNLAADHLQKGSKLSRYLADMLKKNPVMKSSSSYPGYEMDRLYNPNYEHPVGESTCSSCSSKELQSRPRRTLNTPKVHTGLIASADVLMRHAATRDKLGEELGVLCFEMEAAGLMDAWHPLVVRGISDYSDSHKDKSWQPYAAATAAAYAKELLYTIPPEEVTQDNSLAKIDLAGTSNH
jgi:nucleoside phosphorylase